MTYYYSYKTRKNTLTGVNLTGEPEQIMKHLRANGARDVKCAGFCY